MSPASQDRLIIAALVVSESAWIYAMLGIIGLALGTDGSPLGWLAVLALMAAAAVVARMLSQLPSGRGDSLVAEAFPYALQACAGAGAIYLVMGTQVDLSDAFWDLDWPGVVASGSEIAGANFRATVGAIAGVVLWWRGGRLGSSEEPGVSLDRSYKIGTMLMAMAVLVDIGTATPLNTFGALFVFFAGALAGLGVARLGRGAGGGRGAMIWLRAVGAAVAVVLAIGFAFSLVRRSILDAVSAPVTEVLGWMGTVLFYAFLVPIAWVVNGVVRLFVGLFAGDGPTGDVIPVGESIGEQFLQQQSGQTPLFVTALEWILLGIISAAGLFILSRALRRRGRGSARTPPGVRESIREESDPVFDAAEMLYGLLPAALRRRRVRSPILLPAGPPGVVRALRGYYRLLLYAGSLGASRPRSATPTEYSGDLDALVPGGIAHRATAAFNTAFYGGAEPPAADLDEIGAELDRLGAPEV